MFKYSIINFYKKLIKNRMTENELAKKLLIKSGQRIAVLNPPSGFGDKLKPLPAQVNLFNTLQGSFDTILLFVNSKAELERLAPKALKALRSEGIFWISYPKVSSNANTDITRDKGWKSLNKAGWEGVSLVAIDDIWSALRFKPSSEIKEAPAKTATKAEVSKLVNKEKKKITIPEDLLTALKKNKKATAHFESLSFTNKKEYVTWIVEAKKDETRSKRLVETIVKLEKGLKNPAEKK
jgi:hypothetical protein